MKQVLYYGFTNIRFHRNNNNNNNNKKVPKQTWRPEFVHNPSHQIFTYKRGSNLLLLPAKYSVTGAIYLLGFNKWIKSEEMPRTADEQSTSFIYSTCSLRSGVSCFQEQFLSVISKLRKNTNTNL